MTSAVLTEECRRCGAANTSRVSIDCPRCASSMIFCDSCWRAVDAAIEPAYCYECRPFSKFASVVLRTLASRVLLILAVFFLIPLYFMLFFPEPDFARLLN